MFEIIQNEIGLSPANQRKILISLTIIVFVWVLRLLISIILISSFWISLGYIWY